MRIVLPGEADAAEHLDAVLGGVDGRVEVEGGGGRSDHRQLGRRVRDRAGRIPGEHGRGLCTTEQAGAQVLDGLERADRAAELLPDRGVLRRRPGAPACDGGGLDREQRGSQVADIARADACHDLCWAGHDSSQLDIGERPREVRRRSARSRRCPADQPAAGTRRCPQRSDSPVRHRLIRPPCPTRRSAGVSYSRHRAPGRLVQTARPNHPAAVTR